MCAVRPKGRKSLQHLALLALAPLSILGAASPADDFYLVRLQAGKAEAASGRHYEAIEDLRIASFGFLDQPGLLVEGLSRLALAQAAAGRPDESDATLRRFVEIENRFRVWQKADVEPATRAAVVALVEKRLGPEAARALTAPAPSPAGWKSEPAPPVPSLSPSSSASPASIPSAEPTAMPTVTPELAPAPAPAPTPAPGLAGAPAPETVASVLAKSRALVSQGRYVENFRRLVATVAVSPNDRDLRKALLEAATLTKDWNTAASQVEALRPFRGAEEPSMFYAAVALYEKGSLSEARSLVEKALPKLNRSAFVDYYARRILDSSGSPGK